VDAEVGDQILAHSLGPLLGQCQVVVGAALAVTVPGNEKGVAGEAVIAQCAAEGRKQCSRLRRDLSRSGGEEYLQIDAGRLTRRGALDRLGPDGRGRAWREVVWAAGSADEELWRVPQAMPPRPARSWLRVWAMPI